MRRSSFALSLILAALAAPRAFGHDIPNAQVDRATQVVVTPGRLQIDYEVSLGELTLTQELRSLVGRLPGAGRDDWLASYGKETGPLNAKGFFVTIDGEERSLRSVGFDLLVEGHPRYTFHFETELPPSGRLTVQDTNFVSSEGTSRLALRGEGVQLIGSLLPTKVGSIVPRPVWQLTDPEERDTRFASARFEPSAPPNPGSTLPTPSVVVPTPAKSPEPSGLLALLEGGTTRSAVLLGWLALILGASHALLPGHGKTLVVAATLGDGGGWFRGILLAMVTTVTHLAGVLIVALGLWWSRSTRFPAWDDAIGRFAGFLIAAVAVWRVGRGLGGLPIQDHGHQGTSAKSLGDILALGIAGGALPCWDAVALVVFGEAVGRLGLAVLLVLAFSVGLGSVLAGFACLAERFRRSLSVEGGVWSGRLQLTSSLVLSSLGLYLLYRPN